MKQMMKCGHAANATDHRTSKPCCAICVGIVSGYDQVADPIDLSDRRARCAYCKTTQPSSTDLAFFGHMPERKFDDYYCGCRGWD